MLAPGEHFYDPPCVDVYTAHCHRRGREAVCLNAVSGRLAGPVHIQVHGRLRANRGRLGR